MAKRGKRYSPRFQVVLKVLTGDHDVVEIARAYDLHPTTVARWKHEFLENGAEVFGKDGAEARSLLLGFASRSNQLHSRYRIYVDRIMNRLSHNPILTELQSCGEKHGANTQCEWR